MNIFKSKTINFALLLSIAEPVLSKFPVLETFLGDNYGIAFVVLSAIIGGLRAVTKESLAGK